MITTLLMYGTAEFITLPERSRVIMRRIKPSVQGFVISFVHCSVSALVGAWLVSPVFGMALLAFHMLLESPAGAVAVAMQPGGRIHDSLIATAEWKDREAASFQLSIAVVHENIAWAWTHALVFAAAWGVHVYLD